MLTPEQIRHFETLGFVVCRGLFSPSEIRDISNAFDVAMQVARGGAAEPVLERNELGYSTKRQQVVPFFDYNPDVFYPLLDDARLMDAFEAFMGEDFIFTLSEGIIHAGGSRWHHDAMAPDGFFTMRAALYLDPLEPNDGCLSVIPGSHFHEFNISLRDRILNLGARAEDIPGRYPIVNTPGDVLFMNHKLFHAALSDRPGRRAIHINCSQNTTPERNPVHFEWLMKFLEGEKRGWGRFYSDRLIQTAGPRRARMMARAIELGLGNTGPIT
ncbi:MAG: phytanoyl-CoA dioxygenase family protein [candidate division Zixibacteria bacterium]|nr:phytanoyl-CoA dioxygenase family protein [candidate division Zixibacteria bacterium]